MRSVELTFIDSPPYARIYHQRIPSGSVLSALGALPGGELQALELREGVEYRGNELALRDQSGGF